jgi:phosphomethylpyrimidine synthase
MAPDIDLMLSRARYALDWDKMLGLLADNKKAARIFKRSRSRFSETCTMCGEFCAMKKTREVIGRS